MATHEEPVPAWLEAELRAQGLVPPPKQPKPLKREMSKPAYGRGEECQF